MGGSGCEVLVSAGSRPAPLQFAVRIRLIWRARLFAVRVRKNWNGSYGLGIAGHGIQRFDCSRFRFVSGSVPFVYNSFLGVSFCRIGFEPRSSFASIVGLNWGAVAADGRPFHLPIKL